ncbi:extracellular solute-binding protein [Endozoicomonas montiporae]|uniref:Microcin C transport system substrate-binding protein n=1 Tax=Endozoicomonas montiporae CL-33 TaxID=570277 RepID=A0A142BGV6_9GAMM|nr:extracellular solute-binding protein [Endozoicomonas montiporae]AMO57982.1 microcin C transport system substrate-binding protein [Endozoicomonas montiporae CL-33]
MHLPLTVFFLALTFIQTTKAKPVSSTTTKTTISHEFTLIGKSKYPADFTHFDYVNPEAPKGGTLKLATNLNFDSLNPFNNRGTAPPYIHDTHARLMVRSADENYSLYGYVAEQVEYPDDFSWVIFHINPNAKFSDGTSITANDVTFTLNRLKTEASPFFKNLYKSTSAEVLSPQKVRFTFATPGPKAIALSAYMPVLSEHYWSNRSLDDRLTEAPVSSGPLRPGKFIKGQTIIYERVKDHWAAGLPVNKGRYNFDAVRVDVYRDQHAAAEAFKAGLYDLRYEQDASQWPVNKKKPDKNKRAIGHITLSLQYPPAMAGLVFNTRLEKFRDLRVRKALTLLFDFEWINQKLLHSNYQRTVSFFSYTTLQATEPPDKKELDLLQPVKAQLNDSMLGDPEQPPVTRGNGDNRDNQRKALQLLKEAGWVLNKGVMKHQKTGEALTMTILGDDHSQERLLVPFRKILGKIGIDLDIQTVDKSQFRKRVRQFDFDIANWHFWHSLFPGSELMHSFSSKTAQQPGSGNIAGIQHPAIDYLLDKLVNCQSYNELIPAGRALDRILRSQYYLIPKWHTRQLHVLYWNHIDKPDQKGIYWHSHNDWWSLPR